jgi:hypothetical protein
VEDVESADSADGVGSRLVEVAPEDLGEKFPRRLKFRWRILACERRRRLEGEALLGGEFAEVCAGVNAFGWGDGGVGEVAYADLKLPEVSLVIFVLFLLLRALGVEVFLGRCGFELDLGVEETAWISARIFFAC